MGLQNLHRDNLHVALVFLKAIRLTDIWALIKRPKHKHPTTQQTVFSIGGNLSRLPGRNFDERIGKFLAV
jgi:hypothetical protein